MTINFQNMRDIVQQAIADSSNPSFVDACIDQAQMEVARAHRWPELYVRAFFNTEAAYETGTVATDGTTSVTLTDGVWPSTVATNKHRFALSVSDPWYEIATRSSDTDILLSAAYVDDDETAASYIAYRSHYSLASAVDRVEEMWLHDQGTVIPLRNAATDQQVSEFLHRPSGPGTPTHFYSMERDASDNRQVMLGPETPNDVWRVEYTYKKKITAGTFTGNLDGTRWPVILARALSLAYAPEFYQRASAEHVKYKALLAEEWGNAGETETQNIRVGESRLAYPDRDMGYHSNLMGYGRVKDPS